MQEKIKTSNEATVQERPISDEDIQYLRELAEALRALINHLLRISASYD